MYSVKECGSAVYLFIYLNPIEHWNYLGVDETLGPVAVSLRREKLDDHKEHGPQYNYRVIFRTSEVSIHNRDFFFFSFYFSESVFVTSFGLRPSVQFRTPYPRGIGSQSIFKKIFPFTQSAFFDDL